MINATTVQNDVIVRRFVNSMNMAMDAQYVNIIMQLMVDNMIIMYEYAIKEDHNKFAKEVHKLIYHNARCRQYKMQQGNHNASQSMHKVQTCHGYCHTMVRCRGIYGGPVVLPK